MSGELLSRAAAQIGAQLDGADVVIVVVVHGDKMSAGSSGRSMPVTGDLAATILREAADNLESGGTTTTGEGS